MNISVIIPTWNRPETLLKVLGKLLQQAYKDFEILVVDDGSKKQPDYPKGNIKVFKQLHQGPAAARNRGIKEAGGDILVFINDDTLVEDNFLKLHAGFHNKNKEINKGLFGPLLEYDFGNENEAKKWLIEKSGQHFSYKKAENGPAPWYYFWTCNVSIKRNFLINNDLRFDESFPTAAWEDIEFAYRSKLAGLKLFYNPQIKTYHFHEFGLEEVLSRFYSHGRGLYHLGQKIPSEFLPPMGNRKIRMIVKTLVVISGYFLWKNKLKQFLKLKNLAPNWLMQFIVLASKLEGYEYEQGKI